MIRIENLTKTIAHPGPEGGQSSGDEGELFAYLGPNGSGKTTTIKILTGLANPTSGDAYVHGYHVVKETLEAKKQCGLVPRPSSLIMSLPSRRTWIFTADCFTCRAGESREDR